MQGKDGAFEAYPVEEWYNFKLIQRYKALSAEEAEREFERWVLYSPYSKIFLTAFLKPVLLIITL